MRAAGIGRLRILRPIFLASLVAIAGLVLMKEGGDPGQMLATWSRSAA